MKKLITIQHCQAVHHLNGMVGGATEWDLTDTGKKHAGNIGHHLKSKLASEPAYVMYSSDMIRTRQTAELVAKELGIVPIYRKELREINLGSATGKTNEWLKKNQIARPKDTPWVYHRILPDTESMEDVYNRVSKLADEIESSSSERIIVVGHGGSLSAFSARWLHLPVTTLEKTNLLGSAGGVSFFDERDDMARILNVWNDRSYINDYA